MQKNVVREKLKAGECVYGTSLEDCLDPEIPVILGTAGLDFLLWTWNTRRPLSSPMTSPRFLPHRCSIYSAAVLRS